MVKRLCEAPRVSVAMAVVLAWLGAGALAPEAQAAGGRHAAMVVDGNSGRVLMEEQADEPRYPASLTKMMTLYLTFEQFEQGKLRPDTPVKISQEAAAQQPSKLDLEPGQTIAAMDAVKALITKSANDIAVALAEHIGGNERAFAVRMTDKARALGMTRTTFRNASGLPDSGQVTTARDMITLAMRIHDDFPKYYPLFAMKSFSYNGKSHANHNTMLKSFQGTEGMKTGYIGSSGYNVVTSVKRGPKHLFGAVFGGSSGSGRNATMQTAFMKSLPQAATMKSRGTAASAMVASAEPVKRPAAPTYAVMTERARVAELAPAVQAVAAPAAVAIAPVRAVAVAMPAAVPAMSPIAVAQVRRVMVAPRVKPAAPPVETAAAAPAQAPAALQLPQMATTIAAVQPAAQRTSMALPPSTLQAQASALTPLVQPQKMAAMSPPSRLNGPAATVQPPAATTGNFHLQIGAFATQAEADRALAAARARASQLIGDAQQVTIPVQKDNRQLIRARFAGFSAEAAANVCLELRRQQIDCFVMKGE